MVGHKAISCILDLDDNSYNIATPQTNKKSVVTHDNLNNNENSRKSDDEIFCDNSCTGTLFAYHKQKRKFK